MSVDIAFVTTIVVVAAASAAATVYATFADALLAEDGLQVVGDPYTVHAPLQPPARLPTPAVFHFVHGLRPGVGPAAGGWPTGAGATTNTSSGISIFADAVVMVFAARAVAAMPAAAAPMAVLVTAGDGLSAGVCVIRTADAGNEPPLAHARSLTQPFHGHFPRR